MTTPCFECKDRHLRCWSDCERYAAMKSELDEQKKKQISGHEAKRFLIDSTHRAQKRAHKR